MGTTLSIAFAVLIVFFDKTGEEEYDFTLERKVIGILISLGAAVSTSAYTVRGQDFHYKYKFPFLPYMLNVTFVCTLISFIVALTFGKATIDNNPETGLFC